MHIRTLSVALALATLSTSANASARSDSVRRLIDEGRIDVAQAKCHRLGAHYSDTGQDLREVCAEAQFEAALEVNSVMRWIRFQQVWEGTSYARAARDNEAAAALKALGDEAKEHEYAQFMRQYKDTKYALAAKQLLSDSSIMNVSNGREAVRVAQMYPDHPKTPLLVERFLSAFLKMEMNGTDVKVTIDPPVNIPGPPPTGRWAAKYDEEAYYDWQQAAEQHLKDVGVGQQFINEAKAEGFPPCQVPDAGWELGILVEVGSGKAFFPNPGVKECRSRPWPAFGVYRKNALAALSIGPVNTAVFPTDARQGWFDWGTETDAAKIWTPGVAGDPVMHGTVIGQPVGNMFLQTPLAGGMPWYVSKGPPASALKLPIEARTSPLPDGWALTNNDGALEPGVASRTEVTVSGKVLSGSPWKLPAGEVRVMSPIVQQISGLNRFNEALANKRKGRLPVLTGATGPMGSVPVRMNELDQANAASVGRQLNALGIPVRIWKAWEGRLGGTSGASEIVFDGEVGGTPVKGVLDPMDNSSGFRAFVWLRDERSQQGPEEILTFTLDGATYFVWRGKNDKGDYNEAIHFEDMGLIREFR